MSEATNALSELRAVELKLGGIVPQVTIDGQPVEVRRVVVAHEAGRRADVGLELAAGVTVDGVSLVHEIGDDDLKQIVVEFLELVDPAELNAELLDRLGTVDCPPEIEPAVLALQVLTEIAAGTFEPSTPGRRVRQR